MTTSFSTNTETNLSHWPAQCLGTAKLPQLGTISVSGADAAKFLHGQLSHDFLLIKPDQARLAVYCNAQGRMLASFIAFSPQAEQFLLICSADLVAPMVQRLSMFVLRAKVHIRDVTEQYTLFGEICSASSQPETTRVNWHLLRQNDAFAVQLPSPLGVQRSLWLVPMTGIDGFAANHGSAQLAPAVWEYSEILSGLASISLPTSGLYVPQMLNYESLDGVHFQKGCYPGQEVVARSQFRGQIKRRAFILRSAVPLQRGQAVWALNQDSTHGNTEPNSIGEWVQVAPPSAFNEQPNDWIGIACLNDAAARDASVTLNLKNHDSWHELQRLDLPYPLRNDI